MRDPVSFTIHDARGTVLATVDHIEVALQIQRTIEQAEDVRRKSDGVVCATKYRLKGGHLYAGVWAMRTEPEWLSR